MLGKNDEYKMMGTEEATARAILEMVATDKEKVKALTQLSDEEIQVLSLLSAMAEELKLDSIKKIVENFSIYRISHNRAGRKEVTGMVTMVGFASEERNKARNLKSILGMR